MRNEPLILNLETATTVCSVCLSRGSQLLACKEIDEGYTHAENLHVFINQVMDDAGCKSADLQAVALSAGPGSYTGLRIGSSSAKGICFALGIPLISLSTLEILAYAMSEAHPTYTHLCPMLDAGRMEVYTAVFDAGLRHVTPVSALVLEGENGLSLGQYPRLLLAGAGMEKAKTYLKEVLPEAGFMDQLRPSARFMPDLSLAAFNAAKFQEIEYFEPFYLKKVAAGKKKKDQV